MQRTRIIAEAASWIGTPYQHQASLKGAGCDCLGLVRGIYRALYGPEPRVPAYAQETPMGEGERLLFGIGAHLPRVVAPRPGDILLFRLRAGLPARHLGVMVAPTRFVHAVSGRMVAPAALSPWWQRRLVAAFAFPEARE